MAATAPPPHIAKVDAFRGFASQLQGQVVEQLCQEFEREVGIMWNDLVQYRHELERVADLLGQQLIRERQLHEMLDAMAGQHATFANTASMAASQTPNSQALHEMVEQLFGQHSAAMNSTLQGVSQARQIAETHAASAKQLQEPLITAENEYNRIIQMLSTPMIPGQAPRATVAQGADGLVRTAMSSSATPPATPVRPAAYAPMPGKQQCQSCGNIFMDDALYCRKCGVKRPGAPPVNVNALPPNPQQASYTSPPMVMVNSGVPPPMVMAGPPGAVMLAGPPMAMQGPPSNVRLF